ncbi:hypothetical protein TL16_g05666 [Triparma laevis f. inornata]|uniref:Rubredoxin-like domain-containing protein n=2 Tax=Triparma laevis TaxID=1534972 RepID=A0A9W7F838_9STRA|nr:hypothetical protein TL16_g05666 [Triparma laevis f. inornata]GMI06116.1 hypothetical protein TrLO_g2317 [Triparma laevis f. longispina]
MAATTNMASAIPLAFLGYRTSQIMFWLFGAGLIFKLTTQKNPTDKDAPNWAHVVTSKEQEEELHAFTCDNCGFTIFPARGREGKFFPDTYKCPSCGADKESFFDRREEVAEKTIDYEYENKDDYRGSDEGEGGEEGGVDDVEGEEVEVEEVVEIPEEIEEIETPPAPSTPSPQSSGNDLDLLGMDE